MSSLLEKLALRQSELEVSLKERDRIIDLLRSTIHVLSGELTGALSRETTRGCVYCHWCGELLEQYEADGSERVRARPVAVRHSTTCPKSPLAGVVVTARAAWEAYLVSADQPERFQQAMQNIRHALELLDAQVGEPS